MYLSRYGTGTYVNICGLRFRKLLGTAGHAATSSGLHAFYGPISVTGKNILLKLNPTISNRTFNTLIRYLIFKRLKFLLNLCSNYRPACMMLFVFVDRC